MPAGFTSLSAPGGFLIPHTHTGGFKAEPESRAVTKPQLASELMKAGSFQRSISITEAPFQPSVYYCCFQEHTQFTIWPGTLYAPSLMQINIAPLIARILTLLTPRHGLAEQASASSAPRWHASSVAVLQPCEMPSTPRSWSTACRARLTWLRMLAEPKMRR